VKRTFGVSYDAADQILITVGVSEALDLAIRALIEPGDEVLYHEPCYVSYRPVIIFAHGKPVAIETKGADNFRLTRAALEAKVTKRTRLLVLNYPNNPTGAVLDRRDVVEIAAFAKKHDLIVLADEIYSELTYDQKHVSIASLPGMKERTIFLHGFSKAWAMTGFRLGYACGPAPLIDAMMKIHQYTMLCAPITAQEAAVEALKEPERDIAVMKAEYQRRRNYIHATLRRTGHPLPPPARRVLRLPRDPPVRRLVQGLRAAPARPGKGGRGARHRLRRLRRRLRALRLRHLHGRDQGSALPHRPVHQAVPGPLTRRGLIHRPRAGLCMDSACSPPFVCA
jgi:aminotransferase